MMELPEHKMKIVCTIGPSSRSGPVLETIEKSGLMKRGEKMMLIGRNMDEIESTRIIDTGRI